LRYRQDIVLDRGGYVETGFLKDNVAPRKEPSADAALDHHDTPLIIWSNRSGPVQNLGAVSPAFLPYHILTTAGITHPYYTGFLGALREHYRVVDRNLLLDARGRSNAGLGAAEIRRSTISGSSNTT